MADIILNEFHLSVMTTFVERWQIARLQQSDALHTQNQRKLVTAGVFMDIECRAAMRYLVELYQEQNNPMLLKSAETPGQLKESKTLD